MGAKLNVRRYILIAIAVIFVVLFAIRLVKLQLIDGDMYSDIVYAGSTKSVTVKSTRGEIFDRNGVPIVVNETAYDIIIDKAYIDSSRTNEVILLLSERLKEENIEWIDNLPISFTQPFTFLENSDSAISRLKKFLELQSYSTAGNCIEALIELYDLEEYPPEMARVICGVRYEMTQKGYNLSTPYTFAKGVPDSIAFLIEEDIASFSGIYVSEVPARKYTDGTLAPHIIGSIGPIYENETETYKELGYDLNDYVGKGGIEKLLESYLKGESGERLISLDYSGRVISVENTVSPQAGNSVYLTLDYELQKATQSALENRILEMRGGKEEKDGFNAKGGSAVAVAVKTGEVLAMATYPSYDISTFNQDYYELINNELNPLVNRALTGLYAPGSCFKPVTATAGYATGDLKSNTTFYCNHVFTFFEDYQPTCMYTHKTINLKTALQVSCNVFFYELGVKVGSQRLANFARQYGLGESTGIELFEYTGVMASEQNRVASGGIWQPGDVLQAAIGTSDSRFTPLQLAMYTATLANNGVRMNASIVSKITSYDGETIVEETSPSIASVVDAESHVFEDIKKGMVAASHESGGTAFKYFGDYPVKVASKTGTPENAGTKSDGCVFICYAPANDPEIAIAIVIEEGYQGYHAAPIAKEMLDAYFGYGKYATVVETEDTSSQGE